VSGRSGIIPAVVLLAGLLYSDTSFARITPEEYGSLGVTVPDGAVVPLSATVADENGRNHPLADFVTGPTVLVFADYECRTLCGPAILFLADALEQSGLRAGEQYRLVAIGLDGHGTVAAAARMRHERLGARAVSDAASFLTADEATVGALTTALGYRYRYDAEAGQYIHPAAAFVLRADGRVSRVINEMGFSAEDLRLALVEASEGRIGTLGDQMRLICSTFDPAHGTYNLAISRLLASAGVTTIVLLAGGIGLLLRFERHAARR
jgi:protein SCO1/2